ncbi:Rieske (2Fe-2S) protein [Allorhodopirellula solitaria]|uniref:Rieske (2Fe-2S) protein n=1 Tax=Allorhodopirellula solitaria TaxID=2527987 RepID=UPI0011B6E68E|nr:Rieske (2Fe-2S) protein [Allorhodopirellula solitaria]
MPVPNPHDEPPPDTADEADDRDWRLALEITDEEVGSTADVKTISRGQVDSDQDIAVEVLLAGRVIAVFRHAGSWFAMDGICSHQGGPLAAGIVRDGCVTCPWHGWQYDLATGIQMINRQPLQQSFPVRQLNDRVEIQMPVENESDQQN